MNWTAMESRREQILEEMRSLRAMRPGAVSEQYLKVSKKGQAEPGVLGPYFLWQYYLEGKPVRQRLTTAQEVDRAKQEVENYKRFKMLCEEFVTLTQALGAHKEELEAQKKSPKRSSSAARKSSK